MNEFSHDGAIIDAEGRRAAGRNMGVLAREYRELRQQLDAILANGCGLSHEEICVPYAKLATNLRAKLARIADDLEHGDSGQLTMAANNDTAEEAGLEYINRVNQALGG
ncbi:hypothetical protein [Nonomuraea sp. NPDC049400]|uniref:hypothetical protein n=1 Tax=Nonomuraea sp. NPDC049400 TaxID=3364352 RepID=UPI0037924E56